MARKNCIDLVTGTGRRWRRCGAALWTVSALLLAVLSLSGRLPALWLAAGWLLLLVELPALRRREPGEGRVRLYRDGSLTGALGAGAWSPRCWSTAWLSVLPADPGGRPRRLVVAAWRNDPDDYRVLRTWLRHPPVAEAGPVDPASPESP